jgi:regulator of sigma E protease
MIFFAILGLGLLIFFHELGHYFVAKRNGMRVEVFSIGFGKPIWSWKRGDVLWQIGALPFGGFVKIAGMQKEGSREPHEIQGGFYASSPWARIKVALAGPFVNFAIAALLFTALYWSGGRELPSFVLSKRIGWLDPASKLYQEGVRPGDLITRLNGKPYTGLQDLQYVNLVGDGPVPIEGTGFQTELERPLEIVPSRYLLIEALALESPLKGAEKGDRIVWVDGEVIYSIQQLSQLINESTAILTVERKGERFLAKVPRIQLGSLRLGRVEIGEIDDWRFAASLKQKPADLFFIPYILSSKNRVEKRLEFLDPKDQDRSFSYCQRCALFQPLISGDRILAVDGIEVTNSIDLLKILQERHVQIVVQRGIEWTPIPWTESDALFGTLFKTRELDQAIWQGAGGTLVRLPPVTPKTMPHLYQEHRKQLEEETDPKKRSEKLASIEKAEKILYLGFTPGDRLVIYNPSPLRQLGDAFRDSYRTITALFGGQLHPKHLKGPVGIVHVVQQSDGVKDFLYLLALISLGLGVSNLLPLPILDGGHVVLSLYEWIFRRRLSSRAIERLVLPSILFILGFFLFITYHDLLNLLGKLL